MMHISEAIVDNILDDLRDRRGFDDMWNDCDVFTQSEIRETWVALVDAEIWDAA